MKTRFQELLSDIDSKRRNTTGKVGKFIKSTEHSGHYNKRHPGHEDKKGWRWFNEGEKQIAKGKIKKYNVKNRVWWVKPGIEEEFEEWISKKENKK